MTSHRALQDNFRLPLIIETINVEQRYLVKFSPEKHCFYQCIFYEYEEKTVSNFTFQVTFKPEEIEAEAESSRG